MTDTRGEGIMSSVFERYEPVKGDIPHRNAGALICFETGVSINYIQIIISSVQSLSRVRLFATP